MHQLGGRDGVFLTTGNSLRHLHSQVIVFQLFQVSLDGLADVKGLGTSCRLISKVFQPTRGSGWEAGIQAREGAKFTTYGRRILVPTPVLRWYLGVAEGPC